MTDKSKAQIGADNAQAVADYLRRHGAGDPENLSGHSLPMHGGRLNKSRIADELGIGRSVWAQNPACKKLVEEVEATLGIAPAGTQKSGSDSRTRELERRVNQLEGRTAALQVENAVLQAELRKLGWIEKGYSETGRLPW